MQQFYPFSYLLDGKTAQTETASVLSSKRESGSSWCSKAIVQRDHSHQHWI